MGWCNFIMRGGHNLRLTDVHRVQKNIKEKSQKEAEALIQLMEVPDFDTSEFIQTLLKSDNYEEVMQKLPIEKKIDFFAKNYQDFLIIQDELLGLELPKILEIPRAKQFTFETQLEEVEEDNLQESSVLEIIDAFSSFVLEKNIEQTLRIYRIIQDMKKHSKYKAYFNTYSINKIFLETYNSFVDNCTSYEILLKINEYEKAIAAYLQEKQGQILEEIKVNLNINDAALSMGKEMSRLVAFIEAEVRGLRIKFKKEMEKNEELAAVVCDWIQRLTKKYYQLIETYVYEKDELAEILQTLGIVLEASAEMQSKGITLERQLKELTAVDLPLHISKVIEIIVESVNQILKENNDLYEFVYFGSIKNFSAQLGSLKPISKDDFGKKCATCKGIILVNSFLLILQTVCDEKWAFLHEGVIDILISKVALNILNCTLHYWDYYFIYQFFDRLAAGKVRHRELFAGEPSGGVAEKLLKIKGLADQSWGMFENKLSASYFKEILSGIPAQLYSFHKYGYYLEKHDLRPSTFSLSIVFKIQEFLKQIQFRMTTSQFEYLVQVFYQYLLYTIEYVLLWGYHNKGANDKVFILYTKQEKLLKKVKEFNFLEIEDIKQERILNLSKINRYGFHKLVFEIYFLTDVLRMISDVKKIDAEQFTSRISKILAKDQKKEVMDVSKGQFDQGLAKMVKVYKQRPQLMQNYLNDRKKG